ncbi:MAG TPA: CehA/McbA family metallohydrolase [Tepidisphaeraceae bacterium]|jgi:hypothetical protein
MRFLRLPFAAAILIFLSHTFAQIPPQSQIIEGFRPATDASLSTKAIKYVPFDVPRGVTSIKIQRQFTWLGGPAGILDQGVWDPDGFRGWQGGVNRDKDLLITGNLDTTEPHYLPGPLPAGTWKIAQSLLKSPPGGVRYRYLITLAFDGSKPPSQTPAIPKYDPGIVRDGPGWFAGNLHSHSIYSDGSLTLTQVATLNRKAGYDFFVASDHNTYRQDYEIPAAAAANPGLLILYGEEITTPYGHSNVIGIRPGEWFDFRMDAGDGKYAQLVQKAHAEGALIEVNHPYAPCLTCYWRFTRSEWADDDGIEVWNGIWTIDDQLSVFAWDRLLKAGKHFHAYGGSDFHRLPDVISPATLVYAKNLSRDAIMEGLKAGHVVISDNPHGPMIEFSINGKNILPGDTILLAKNASPHIQIHISHGAANNLEVIWSDGSMEKQITQQDEIFDWSSQTSLRHFYLRAELIHEGKMHALTNPIFVDRK